MLLLFLAWCLAGCAHHEPGRYQVKKLTIKGQEDLKERPVLSCLVSRQRPRFGLTLGRGDAKCGEPPFDSQAPRLNLWRWWWEDWPAFNRAVFDEDMERVLRWYRARGYYDARVTKVEFDPPAAMDPSAEAPCDLENDVCPVRITVTVEEGEPTLTESVEISGLDTLTPKLRKRILAQRTLKQGVVIDEADYEKEKSAIVQALRQKGYADPKVTGEVRVNTRARRARVRIDVDSGPLYTFGSLTLEGEGQLPRKPIIAAANLKQGQRFSPLVLEELQKEVYALGAFTAVEVHEELDEEARRVDVHVKVTPQAPRALRLGVGVLSGAQQRTSTGELASIPQWDIHLLGRYERRHVFGTLGKLTIEERPRMIFSSDFPRVIPPRYGNLISVKMNQPGLVEKRTDLFTENAFDYGPDPYLGFFRSDIFFRVGMRRGFWRRRFLPTIAIQQDVFLVSDKPGNQTSDGSELPFTYGYTFLEEDLRLDLRDNPARPRIGAYFGLNTTQALRWRGSDWTAFRVGPEVRGYLPLFLDIVWASRFAMAGMFITDADSGLDDTSQQLGPNAYRLRGGGANSNRGFLAGTLGVGLQGGIRRWEASSELRVPFGESLVLAGFADLGDVNDTSVWRFDHLNLSVGWGFRFYTILGAIRLDTGLRVLSLQRADGSDGVGSDDSRLFGAPGALHLTIGDAF